MAMTARMLGWMAVGVTAILLLCPAATAGEMSTGLSPVSDAEAVYSAPVSREWYDYWSDLAEGLVPRSGPAYYLVSGTAAPVSLSFANGQAYVSPVGFSFSLQQAGAGQNDDLDRVDVRVLITLTPGVPVSGGYAGQFDVLVTATDMGYSETSETLRWELTPSMEGSGYELYLLSGGKLDETPLAVIQRD
jgi:hypothetical protein